MRNLKNNNKNRIFLMFRNCPLKGAQRDAVYILSAIKCFLKRMKQKRSLKVHPPNAGRGTLDCGRLSSQVRRFLNTLIYGIRVQTLNQQLRPPPPPPHILPINVEVSFLMYIMTPVLKTVVVSYFEISSGTLFRKQLYSNIILTPINIQFVCLSRILIFWFLGVDFVIFQFVHIYTLLKKYFEHSIETHLI